MFASVAAYALVAVLSQTGAVNDQFRAAAVSPQAALPSSFAGAPPIAVQAEVAGAGLGTAALARPPEGRSAALVGLYVSFGALEALDIHSTLRAMGNGAAEANPAMRGVVSNPASFIAVKAASGVAIVWMAEKIRKQHPSLAIALMAGLNSVMATVVAHNYSIK